MMDEELLYTQADIDEWIRTCEELQEKIKEQEETIEQLSEYRSLEEQDLIVRLPCKIDTFVYAIDKFIDRIIYGQLTNIGIDRYCATYTALDSEYNQYYHCRMVFLTRAEAEKKLKELKGELK